MTEMLYIRPFCGIMGYFIGLLEHLCGLEGQ